MKNLFVIIAVVTLLPVTWTDAQKYTHPEALDKIQSVGIAISSSGGCSDRENSSCTSLDQVRVNTIDNGAVILKNASGCAITITGGTEVGHAIGTYSHYNGYKLDYRLTTCLNDYIKVHYTFIGNRDTDGAPQYESAAGSIYALETDHWDVVYY